MLEVKLVRGPHVKDRSVDCVLLPGFIMVGGELFLNVCQVLRLHVFRYGEFVKGVIAGIFQQNVVFLQGGRMDRAPW